MRPAENPLARARQQAHANLRQQALERAGKLLNNSAPGTQIGSFLQNAMRPGNVLPRGAQGALSGGGHPESASSLAAHQATNAMGQQLAGANLGGALNGGGPAPSPMLPGAPAPNPMQPQVYEGLVPYRGGIDQILPRLPEQPERNFSGGNPLIHLGAGIFLHALTGELHGLGQQYAPHPVSAITAPGGPMGGGIPHPGPVAF